MNPSKVKTETLQAAYARLCAELGHVEANLDKLQKEKTRLLAQIKVLDAAAAPKPEPK